MSQGGEGVVLVIGGGPAGLAAAVELTRHGESPLVIDKNERLGGLSRTVWHNGYGFDIGPHRFFTKDAEAFHLWHEFVGDEMLEVDRLTRIFHGGRYFDYPLKPMNALLGLGPRATIGALASYIRQRVRMNRPEPQNFEEWVIGEFGRVLYETFFKSYTEKVWGIPCHAIDKEWAAQRIRGLSLRAAIKDAFGLNKKRGSPKSLVDRFHYPRYGAGQPYERMGDEIVGSGGKVECGATVVRLLHENQTIVTVEYEQQGHKHEVVVDRVIASSPITHLVKTLDPSPDGHVLAAADALTYRSHITVNLIVDQAAPFPDNWIYIHAPELKMARVANYASFSEALIGAPGTAGLAVEYFCFEGDELWSKSDDQLVSLAVEELGEVGLIEKERVTYGFVIREPDSYPAYYLGHREQFETLAAHVHQFSNLALIGRAGMYRYNNQDHALLTGLYGVRNLLGLTNVNLRDINPDDEYQEEIRATDKARIG